MPKVRRGTSDSEILTRFWSKVQKSRGCWLWTGNIVRGYGQFAYSTGLEHPRQRHVYAHRFSYELAHGPIPHGQQVCHRCDTRLCVRLDHLFLGTQQENLDDARRKGRLIDGLGARKLSDEAYRHILTGRDRGIDLARFYGVTRTTISRIRNGHQGRATFGRQLILQDQSSQPEARLRGGDVTDQPSQPVNFEAR